MLIGAQLTSRATLSTHAHRSAASNEPARRLATNELLYTRIQCVREGGGYGVLNLRQIYTCRKVP